MKKTAWNILITLCLTGVIAAPSAGLAEKPVPSSHSELMAEATMDKLAEYVDAETAKLLRANLAELLSETKNAPGDKDLAKKNEILAEYLYALAASRADPADVKDWTSLYNQRSRLSVADAEKATSSFKAKQLPKFITIKIQELTDIISDEKASIPDAELFINALDSLKKEIVDHPADRKLVEKNTVFLQYISYLAQSNSGRDELAIWQDAINRRHELNNDEVAKIYADFLDRAK